MSSPWSGIASPPRVEANRETKLIRVNEKMTVLELHRELSDMCDREDLDNDSMQLDIIDQQPTIRHTDQFITVVSGWSVIGTELLYAGSLTMEDAPNGQDVYTSVMDPNPER